MRKIFISGLIAGVALLILNLIGLNVTIWIFPGISTEYFDAAFDVGEEKIVFYYFHPFIMAMALAWFWSRFKGVLSGSFLSRGIEFGLIYVGIATFPMLWLVYSAINVSLAMVATWFVLALLQGIFSGLIFEKINP